ESFLRLMHLGADREIVEDWRNEKLGDYEDATALLAVHAAIAFSDAALIWLTGERSKGQDHRQAAPTLRSACGRHQRKTDGIRHFEWLIARKDSFAYGEQRVSSS